MPRGRPAAPRTVIITPGGGRAVRRMTLAVDIDGTITVDGAGTIDLAALGALRGVASAGHNVVFVSGRSSVEAYLLAVFGGTTRVAVGENGGCVTIGPDEHVLVGDRAACVEALGAIESEIAGVRQKRVFPRLTEVVLERTFDLDAARRVVSDRGLGVSLSDSLFAYHINSAGVDKGSGLAHAARMLGADMADVVAIGDSETDTPMLRLAGAGVALANAPESVKSAASMVTDAPAGGGVVEAVDRLAGSLAAAAG